MDTKQKRIFNDIIEKFKLPKKAHLVQFRNLKEFKYFNIEKINPNHIIELYGKLKKKYKNTNRVHVGRILIPYICITNFIYYFSTIQIINILTLIISACLISTLFIYITEKINIMRLLYDCIDRRNNRSRQFREWKNFNDDSLFIKRLY